MKTSRFLILFLTGILLITLASCSKTTSPNSGCSTCPEENPVAVAASLYIDEHRSDFQLRERDDQMVVSTIFEDINGMHHVRMKQHYKGIRVIGGELIVHINPDLTISRVNGMTIPGITINTNINIPSEDALNTALDHFQADGFNGAIIGNGEIVIHRMSDGSLPDTNILSWIFDIRSDRQLAARLYYINAHTGNFLKFVNLIIS